MKYKIEHAVPLVDRANFIASLCKGRCVMHLGCAAWPLTAQQLEDGSLLHLGLSKVSRRIYGIDLSEEGLSFLRKRGFKDLIRWDVEKLDELRVEEPVDVIVSGEILEHLSNPGLFLRGISRLMKREKSKLVISVPNAFSIRHFVPVMLRQTERVMDEHSLLLVQYAQRIVETARSASQRVIYFQQCGARFLGIQKIIETHDECDVDAYVPSGFRGIDGRGRRK
jgi:predicted TPR repeat methyltransferase